MILAIYIFDKIELVIYSCGCLKFQTYKMEEVTNQLDALLLNMKDGSKKKTIIGRTQRLTDAVKNILKVEPHDIVFAQEILSPKKLKWLSDKSSYESPISMTGSETAVILKKDIFSHFHLVKGIDIKEQIENHWGDDTELLQYVPDRITIVELTHRESEKHVLAVSWHGPCRKKKFLKQKMNQEKKIFIFKAILKLCMEVRDQSTKPGIVIGGDFNLSIARAKLSAENTDFVVETYNPSERRKGRVIDYFVHTKDINMTDIAPIWHYPIDTAPKASGAKDTSSVSAQKKVEENGPSPDRSDDANSFTGPPPSGNPGQGNTGSLESGMENITIDSSSKNEQVKEQDRSPKGATSGKEGGFSSDQSSGLTKLPQDHDPLKAKISY